LARSSFRRGARGGDVGGLRPGEPLRARWRHYDTTFEPLGRLLLPKTKTDVPREIPVHPTLALLLDAWKRGGWERDYGRAPTPDDLILPNGRWKRRDDKDGQHTFVDDLENTLGMRRRRRVDLRRTFASLVRSDGANPSIVRTVTHPSPRDILDVYTTFDWPTRCAEVAKLRVRILDGELVGLGTVLGTVPVSTRTPKPKKRNPLPTMRAQNDTTSNDDVPIPVGEARAFVHAETPSPILDVPSLGTAIEKAIREGDTARALELVTQLRNLR